MVACVSATAAVAVVELLVGWWFDLLSIFVEGVHTVADLADSLVALGLITLAARPPDKCHPYGHGKLDSAVGIIEGLCVTGTGVWALVTASRALLGYATVEPRPAVVALVAMACASVLYWFLSAYVLRIAQTTRSPAVYAEGVHLRTHVYVTAGLLVGLALSWVARRAGWAFAHQVDPAVAVMLGLVLIVIGVRIVRVGYRQMVDSALPPDEIDKIARCLDEFRGEFVEVHAVRTRQAGVDRHIDVHLVVPGEATVQAAHDLAHRIERRIIAELPGATFLVHIEPAVGDLLHRYEQRGRRGEIIVDQPGSAEQESTHHDQPRTHVP